MNLREVIKGIVKEVLLEELGLGPATPTQPKRIVSEATKKKLSKKQRERWRKAKKEPIPKPL